MVTDRPTRVALVLDNLHVGGTELNTLKSARALKNAGVDVFLFHLQADGPLADAFDAAGIPRIHVPIHAFGEGRILGDALRLRRAARRYGVDILHSQDIYSNTFAALATRFSRLPFVASQRWTDAVPSRLVKLGGRFALSVSDAVVVNSNAVAAHARWAMLFRKRPIIIVPNIVLDDLQPSDQSVDRTALRGRLGLPPGVPLIICVARLSVEKNHTMLLSAFADLRRGGSDAHLALVGDGPERASIEAEVARLGLCEAVTFAGYTSDVHDWLHAADIACLSSTTEGFPNAITEAMAAGLPVVATAVGGVPDVVKHGITGLLSQPSDPIAFASNLELLLRDESQRRKLAEAGSRFVRERHTAHAAADQLLSVYAGALERHGHELRVDTVFQAR